MTSLETFINKQVKVLSPCHASFEKGIASYHFYGVYQSVHVHCNAKNCVFIAAILSELHAPWQPVMQGYVTGLATLNLVKMLLGGAPHVVVGTLKIFLDRHFFFTNKEFSRVLSCHVAVSSE